MKRKIIKTLPIMCLCVTLLAGCQTPTEEEKAALKTATEYVGKNVKGAVEKASEVYEENEDEIIDAVNKATDRLKSKP